MKRFVLGLVHLVGLAERIPVSIQGEVGEIMKALVFLCQKSIAISEEVK